MSLPLRDLTVHLDAYLRVAEVADAGHALNGLQVQNAGTVSKVAVAVDACQATIDASAAHDADLLLVHHGLFWAGLEPLTGRHGRRVRSLIRRNIALYSAHLPLDLHPEVGNNAVLARLLGLDDPEPFGDYLGQQIGVKGTLSASRTALVDTLRDLLGVEPRVIPGGSDDVRCIGIITGGGGSMIRNAVEAGVDTFITGEGAHHTYFDAEEAAINVIYAGHYATETVGVKALAQHIAHEFGLPWVFLDHPTGL
jgi:dinuclear metal center YbgI/SA1388 family protein